VSQKSAKKKAKKSAKRASESGVLGSLRSTRPSPIGGERRSSARQTTAAKPAKAKASKPAKAKAKAAKAAKAKVKPTKRVAPPPKPAPTRVPPPPDGRPSGPQRGAEIVTTAVQAAGELAQIGVTVGAELLRRAARRIPRP
jgi:hypothetical protein